MTETHLLSQTETEVTFYFVCESCGSEGEITLAKMDKHSPLPSQPFGCPEECEAVYVLWESPEGWRLTCVVYPVMEEQ